MHIGIEVKKSDIIIVSVTGERKNLKPQNQLKLALDNDSMKECIDFKKSFEMYIKENEVSKISLIVGGNDSSKIRTIVEYLIQEIAFLHSLEINTYASSALSKLKEKFKKEIGSDFKSYYSPFGFNVYSENAFLVSWRFS
jgi:hypothetical protein